MQQVEALAQLLISTRSRDSSLVLANGLYHVLGRLTDTNSNRSHTHLADFYFWVKQNKRTSRVGKDP